MRTLTESEIADEATAIRSRRWPHGNILLMKNLYRSECGLIRRVPPDGAILPTVFPGTFLKGAAFKDGKTSEPFTSLEELIRAGWVVD